MSEFKFIVRDYSEVEPEKPKGVLIGNQRYLCMDARFDGEKYHFAMASLDEKTYLYTTQVDNKPMEVIKSFSEQDEIAQFWKFKNFGIKNK